MKRSFRGRFALLSGPLALALVTVACVTGPLNHSLLKTKSDEVLFQGFGSSPGEEIRILIRNNSTQALELLGTATTSGTPSKDAVGMAWYYWSTKLKLPAASEYWTQVNNQLQVRVMARNSLGGLVTYDEGVQVSGGCWQKNWPGGAQAIIAACKSADSPFVTLAVSCGGVGQPCCGQGCNFGSLCSNGTCSLECGGSGKACCAGGVCGAGTTCKGGSCLPCGGSGQACCANNTCKSGSLVCKGESCLTCGGSGQPCCAGTPCGSGNTCVGGFCQACGAIGQPCCGGGAIPCSSGGECGGSKTCVPACAQWGTSCEGSVSCCAGTTCLSVPNIGKRCCHSVDPNFGCN